MRKISVATIALILAIFFYDAQASWSGPIQPIGAKVSYVTASWYGAAFHGKQTASGQLFDMFKFTCAHKNYPFGTLLKITNIWNDKTVFCTVNDRGPFEGARDLDLSYAAARVIDMMTLGIAVVRIEYMGIDTQYFKAVMDIFKTAH